MSDSHLHFFTSDTHFYHKNVIKFCNRPYADVEEMNAGLIQAWNSVVPRNGTVWHLGDFGYGKEEGWESVLNQLNGHIKLVPGNHDPDGYVKHCAEKGLVEVMPQYLEQKLDGVKLVMCHFPIMSWNGMHRGSIHIHGHCHGSLGESEFRRVDVGVDARPQRDLKPWTWAELQDFVSTKEVKRADR